MNPVGFDRPDLWWLVLLWLPMFGIAWTTRRKVSRRRWWRLSSRQPKP